MDRGIRCRRLLIVLALVLCPSLQAVAMQEVSAGEAGSFGVLRPASAADIGVYEFRSLVPVYRFWSPISGKHFYTIDPAERDMLINQYAYFWTPEGIAYYVYARDSVSGLMPVYRFWSPVLSGHFYTVDEAERDRLIDEYPDVWTFEGTAFYAYPASQPLVSTSPVYRFWSPVLSGHFYTMDEAERNMLVDQYPAIWTEEGIAWYAYADPNAVESSISQAGIFEFAGGSDAAACTLTLKAAIDGAEATIDDPQLTFGSQTGYLRMKVDFDALTATIEEVLIESASSQHTTTIRGGNGVVIPVTLTSSVIFWGATPRGPLQISPQTLTFPAAGETLVGGNETFTLTGSISLDDRNLTTGLAVRATQFAEGRAGFEAGASSDLMNVRVIAPFEWSRSGHSDRLLQTTVDGHQLQLYVTAADLQMTGLWEGTETE
ncbi:MAG: hypothetical protein ACM3VT_01610 [Solirubrobacterales bacterium]